MLAHFARFGAEGIRVWGSWIQEVKDFEFVPLMFVTLGLGCQIPLLGAALHGLGTKTP